MEKAKRIYFIATAIVSAVMLFSIINFTFFDDYLYPEGAFRHLKLPNYFKVELTIAKIAGLLALWVPGLPSWMKEFAYIGFGITLLSASFAHFSVGDGFLYIIDPLIFFCVLIISYRYYHRIRLAGNRQELA